SPAAVPTAVPRDTRATGRSVWAAVPAVGLGQDIAAELAGSRAYRQIPKDQRPAVEEVLIEHLGFFKEYDVVEDFDVLRAIEQVEQKGT
ncbi:MAG: hypothetical protein J7M21_03185, partial [Planctomycetes bacterium]|nr:hypothetical protein [Planctomycetota bacterium]